MRVYENTSVLTRLRQGKEIVGVRTARGEIRTPALIGANGAWALNLTTQGIDLPLSPGPQRQILIQPLPPAGGPSGGCPRGVRWASALTFLASFSPGIFRGPNETLGETALRYDATVSLISWA